MTPRTRPHRKPASRLKLAAHSAVIAGGVIASVIGGMPSAQASQDDAVSENLLRTLTFGLFSGPEPAAVAPEPVAAPNTANAPVPQAAPTSEPAHDEPEPVARKRQSLRQGLNIDDGPVVVQPPGGDPADPEPGSYSGGWAGGTVVTAVSVPRVESEVDTFDAKVKLQTAWNLADVTLENLLAEKIATESDGKLYNVNVNLAIADEDSHLSLTVSPKNKRISLFYMVGGHRMTAKVDADSAVVNDPTATMTFATGLRLVLSTDTWPDEPLKLRSADAVVMVDANGVKVDGDWTYTVGSAVRWLKNLGDVDSIEQTISDQFSGASSDVSGNAQSAVKTLNDDLEVLIGSLDDPVTAIVPRYDDETYRLVLRLDTRPAVMQNPEATTATR